MAVEVSWTKQALDDIENIANYIAKDSHHYAVIQAEKFFQRSRVLEKQPQIGQIVPEIGDPLIRQLLEGNYRIIYKGDFLDKDRCSNHLSQKQIVGQESTV